MRSLQKILDLSPNIIYPAHGPVIYDSNDRIQHYIHHRMQREAEIISVLSEVNAPISTKDIVLRVYKNLPEGVFRGAVNNVNLHLKKLQLEGKVGLCDRSVNNDDGDIEASKESCCSLRNEQEDLVWKYSVSTS
jgi:endoribonuclease LACTB2